jgi:hypothetical protein
MGMIDRGRASEVLQHGESVGVMCALVGPCRNGGQPKISWRWMRPRLKSDPLSVKKVNYWR